MATKLRKILSQREDMTDWLIHFTKDNEFKSARDVLIDILEQGLLKPAWGIRTTVQNKSTNRTVFGPLPAVCFSEQPIGMLPDYIKNREGAKPYGVIVHKHDAYAEGALPVIYGSTQFKELRAGDVGYVAGQRTIDPQILSLQEQFRYVGFALYRYGQGPMDWTHEREWRWADYNPNAYPRGGFELGGSGRSSGLGMSEGRIHVFVEKDADIQYLQTQLGQRWTVQKKEAVKGTIRPGDWVENLENRVHVFSLEEMERELRGSNRKVFRIETWLDFHKRVPLV
jgi:hypothetical protein